MVVVTFYIYEGMRAVGTYEWYEEQPNGFDDFGNPMYYYIT